MNAATKKFCGGGDLLIEDELKALADVDKCRYVVDAYFKNGFSSNEVATKLNELLPVCSYSPIEVHAWLSEFYGPPGG